MKPRELLTEWHEKASLNFASRFLLTKLYEQAKLDFVRDTLMTSFPPRYFQALPGQRIAPSKINWIRSLLLVPDRLSAAKALYEIALLLKYCQSSQALWASFKDLQSNPINLRSFFFELFIYKAFDDAGIPTTKKPQSGKQELEGYCTVKGQEFLFECKLPYIPSLDELFLIQQLMSTFHQHGYQKSPLNGYIAQVQFTRPIGDEHREELEKKIITFYNGLPHGVVMEVDYSDPWGAGLLRAETYTKERLDEIEKEKKAEIIYYMAPTGQVGSNGEVQMEGKMIGKWNILRDKLYKKLETILKAEKRQHPPEQFPFKIVFIGSESFPEFRFGLFQHENMYDLDRIVTLCNKLRLGSVICFIRKCYQQDQPYILVDVIAPRELLEVAQLLKHIFGSITA